VSEENKKIAVGYIEAMGNGEGAKAAAYVSPDCKFITKGFGKVSGTRLYDEMVPILGSFKQLAPTGLRPVFKSVTAEGDRVAVELEGNAVLCNGMAYHNQYVMMFTIQGGKIKQLDEYLCTKHADEALMAAVAALQATAQ
jgi:ketosteroid isomerase-like protein